MKRLVIFFGALVFVFVVASILVLFGRGYRINLDEKTISGTGILTIDSTPDGAEILLEGEFKGTTDASIPNLKPGKYNVKVTKEGFSTWEKEILIEKEKVLPIEIVLFKSAPDLSALTSSGIISPKISSDGKKIVYGVDTENKSGVWVIELSEGQFIFSKSPKQIAKDSDNFVFSASKFLWSPDSNSILISGKNSVGKQINYLLDSGNLNESFEDVSSEVKELKSKWQEEEENKLNSSLKSLGEKAEELAKGADKVLVSPDGERVLIIKKGQKPIVYDSNPVISPGEEPKEFNIPQAQDYIWYPQTSRHIILVGKESISIVESDGQNNVTIYTGNFSAGAIFPWTDGSKIAITTTLNSSVNERLNLYTISLR